jgi:hypothetical protein
MRRRHLVRAAIFNEPRDITAGDRRDATLPEPTDAVVPVALACTCRTDLWRSDHEIAVAECCDVGVRRSQVSPSTGAPLPDFAAEGFLDGLEGVGRVSLLRLLEELHGDGVPLAELRRAVIPSGSRRKQP